MGDIEFISSILIFLRFGISSEITQKAINDAYDLFDKKYEEAEEDKEITAGATDAEKSDKTVAAEVTD